MANNPGSPTQRRVATTSSRAEIDVGLRQFLLSVYNYMGSGLALTGAVAYVAAESGLYASLIKTPLLFWGVVLAPLALVLWLSFRIEKMSLGAAQAAFWAYAGLIGLSLSGIFIVYTGASIAEVFLITAATFGAMSLFGYTTKTDLSRFGSFLMMGLIGVIIASVVNMFLRSPGLQFAISIIGVLVFVGLTAWDTQRIKAIYLESDDSDRRQEGDHGRARALSRLLEYLPVSLAAAREPAAKPRRLDHDQEQTIRSRPNSVTPTNRAPMAKREYKESLRDLQVELVKVQKHVIKHGHKLLLIFEGRDASGKDGAIKRIVAASEPPRNPRGGAWPSRRSRPGVMVFSALCRRTSGRAGNGPVQSQLV